ncbi:hypothetical protein TNCV_1346491 [Trichonephila clavipes]|nr:hypothetical protein TNCV_1346491 [Trichonephila clavipes]
MKLCLVHMCLVGISGSEGERTVWKMMNVLDAQGSKSFEMCTNCSAPTLPAHILECLGLTKQDLVDDPLLVLVFLRVCDFMDLV